MIGNPRGQMNIYEKYLSERGLMSAGDFFRSGLERYPAALPEEIALAMLADRTRYLRERGAVVPEGDLTTPEGQCEIRDKGTYLRILRERPELLQGRRFRR